MFSIVDKIAKRFVRTAAEDLTEEIDKIKESAMDVVPVVVVIAVLAYTVIRLTSPTNSKIAGPRIIQHIYNGATTIIYH